MQENAPAEAPRPRELVPWLLLVVPVVVGLAASASLLVDYARPAPVFCSYEGGCEQMKHTIYAAFLGIPTPVYGVSGFLALGALSLWRGPIVRRVMALVAAIGVAVSVFLISVQARFGVFCPYCMVTDVCVILVGAAAAWRLVGKWDPPAAVRTRGIAAGALALAALLPLLAGLVMKPKVPAPIAEEMAKTPPGKVTVVDFVDFECPFCRETHAEFSPILHANADKVRVVRKNVPLTRIHPHALEAARAACCGEELGNGDAFAEALFATPVEDLTRAGCEKIAQELGLDVEKFRACVRSAATDERIKADSEAFKSSGGHGLPTIWIDAQKLEGAQDAATLESAVQSAIRARS
jgi:protein-disulfide isomerase/uncharacterized membrane protein